jgi:hypothetical protein
MNPARTRPPTTPGGTTANSQTLRVTMASEMTIDGSLRQRGEMRAKESPSDRGAVCFPIAPVERLCNHDF